MTGREADLRAAALAWIAENAARFRAAATAAGSRWTLAAPDAPLDALRLPLPDGSHACPLTALAPGGPRPLLLCPAAARLHGLPVAVAARLIDAADGRLFFAAARATRPALLEATGLGPAPATDALR